MFSIFKTQKHCAFPCAAIHLSQAQKAMPKLRFKENTVAERMDGTLCLFEEPSLRLARATALVANAAPLQATALLPPPEATLCVAGSSHPLPCQKQKKKHRFGCFLLWRRQRDSNPRGVAPKRFSRPPRYDRFDMPPYKIRAAFSRSEHIILYHKHCKLSSDFEKNEFFEKI